VSRCPCCGRLGGERDTVPRFRQPRLEGFHTSVACCTNHEVRLPALSHARHGRKTGASGRAVGGDDSYSMRALMSPALRRRTVVSQSLRLRGLVIPGRACDQPAYPLDHLVGADEERSRGEPVAVLRSTTSADWCLHVDQGRAPARSGRRRKTARRARALFPIADGSLANPVAGSLASKRPPQR
jgi:hypothetical protein